jgi:hypothetical protein
MLSISVSQAVLLIGTGAILDQNSKLVLLPPFSDFFVRILAVLWLVPSLMHFSKFLIIFLAFCVVIQTLVSLLLEDFAIKIVLVLQKYSTL